MLLYLHVTVDSGFPAMHRIRAVLAIRLEKRTKQLGLPLGRLDTQCAASLGESC